ncbi:thiamine-phosphate kinase [Patulibacter minatonensis]|uniref:thiamine-phosphate kinase n=1 Tax=Patulibacter minatonensis TaxID=298163 RepID=UPI00047B703D|nr:thiamine-phosphate kinase [Patulibacter minatonensis]
MGERALIQAFTAGLKARDGRLLIGPGDDAAVVRPAGAVAVTSTDTTVLGVHLPDRHPLSTPEVVGHRALATALSDLAAMGVAAGEAYVALTVPADWDDDHVLRAVRSLEALAARTGTTVAGGDVTSGPALVMTVTVVGWASGSDALLRRDRAWPGDRVGVTGALGGSGAGLALVLGDADRGALDDAVHGRLLERYLRPRPRLEAGLALNEAGVRCGIDLSDGAATDAAHVGRASGVVLDVDLDLLPLQAGVADVARALGRDPMVHAASAGEDFELLVTAPPTLADRLSGITWVGVVREPGAGESPGVRMLRDGAPVAVRGHEHRA